MQQLISVDKYLFRLINSSWSNPVFDWLMPWLRNANVWAPLYLFMILLILINFKKTGWVWVLFAAGNSILTDFVSSTIIKGSIWRVRPCNDPEFSGWINILVGHKPQNSSFTSSHAANHFGIAMFIFLTLQKDFGKWPQLFFIWAAMISYAQVYVGVHFPLDVIGGSLIGILIGYLSGRSFNRYYGLA